MGVLSKLKGIFYDEVVVDEDDDEEEVELNKVNKFVKSEPVKPVIEEKPKIEEIDFKSMDIEEEKEEEPPKAESTFSERDLFRSERTFNFVDLDEEEEEKEIVPTRRNVLNEQNRSVRVEAPTVSDSPKVFKPTPVISPIWGVMNKDYKVEEIEEKEISSERQLNSAVTTYDTVRRKAYGTLEDELEDTLNSMNNKVTTDDIKEEIDNVEKDVDYLDQKTSKIEDLINKIEEETKDIDNNLSIGELEDRVELENFEDEEPVKEEEVKEDATLTDKTLEHDLFNLIDSMYDDKEE